MPILALCRKDPGIAAEQRKRPRTIGITLRRPCRPIPPGRANVAAEGASMGRVSRDRELGQIPEGYNWCPHCNGYGSSLQDRNERCARCNGTGLSPPTGRAKLPPLRRPGRPTDTPRRLLCGRSDYLPTRRRHDCSCSKQSRLRAPADTPAARPERSPRRPVARPRKSRIAEAQSGGVSAAFG